MTDTICLLFGGGSDSKYHFVNRSRKSEHRTEGLKCEDTIPGLIDDARLHPRAGRRQLGSGQRLLLQAGDRSSRLMVVVMVVQTGGSRVLVMVQSEHESPGPHRPTWPCPDTGRRVQLSAPDHRVEVHGGEGRRPRGGRRIAAVH